MPWMGITLTPGVNSELTPTALQAGYTSTTLGRFKAGLFQKVGGWTKLLPYNVGGSPKAINSWKDIEGNSWLGIGTTTELDVFTGTTEQTLTPQTFTSNTAKDFTTTIGSPVVTIVDANISTITHYCSVFFNTPVTVDGIILSGMYAVTSVLSATSYTITALTNGAAGVSHGGAVPAFTTTLNSNNVKVTFANHGLSVGNDIVFPLSTTVGGAAISGRYVVQSVQDGDNFYINLASQATSSAGPINMNSGNAGFIYYIAGGPTPATAGYGTGNYGAGAYGIGVSSPGMTGTSITATDWTLGNWGSYLTACPENGGIYYWPPDGGIQNAVLISTAPPYNSGMFISTAQQVIVAYGSSVNASIGVYQDPMTIKWCNVQDFTSWTPGITNQAGSFRIPTGSKLIAGIATPFSNLIWSDVELWSMNYIGAQLVFGFTRIGSNCGIIGKHAFTQLAGNIYWLGLNNFFVLSGGAVSILPCSVWDAIYQDLDTTNMSKCFAGSNTLFGEFWVFYPSIADNLGYPSRYVKHNILENTWDLGVLQRNNWIDQTAFGPPLSCTNNGIVYSHENGMDADTGPMTSGFTTGYFYIDEGREFVFIDRIFPDFRWGEFGGTQGAIIQVTVNAVGYPGDTPKTYGPFTVTQASQYISTRIRARQISLTIQSTDSGSFWRLGHIRVRYSQDGRR